MASTTCSSESRSAAPRLGGAPLICLGTVDWLVVHSVAEYTMQELARTNRVLFVEPFQSALAALRVAKSQKRRMRTGSGIRRHSENLYVYSPPPLGLPGISRWRWPARVNAMIFSWLIRRVMKKLAMADPIVFTYLYDTAGVLERIPSRLSVYECIDQDEVLARDDRHRALVREREAATCRAADLVIAITEELAAPRRRYNSNTVVVNAAADLDFFGQARLETTRVPHDLARLPKPVLGYMGGLDPWKMDVDLIRSVAQSHPEWSIALIGYVWYGFDPKQFGCPNIHVLGPKNYEDFPAYLKGIDVCLMPFPLNDITRNGDALKLYEYLAAGKPVVSVPVPAAMRQRDVVAIASTAEEFIAAIETVLKEPPGMVATRLQAIQCHSWAHRTSERVAAIEQSSAKRGTEK